MLYKQHNYGKKKKEKKTPDIPQSHPRYAPSAVPTSTRVAAQGTGPSENSSGKMVVFGPTTSLILVHSRAMRSNCVSPFRAFFRTF